MKLPILSALLIAALSSFPVHGQSLTVEADATAGYSTDEISAVATQLRAFGDLKSGIRFYLEGAWATRSEAEVDTDAFGAAYPYYGRVQAIEAYAEGVFRPRASLVSVRAGRFRTPFGISGRSDHAYSGFLRAPLIRYDDYFALSNNFLENGVDFIVGIPALYVETSLGTPGDVGEEKRRFGLDTVVRAQGYYGPWIVGVSHIRTLPHQPETFASGRAVFSGIDLRWTHDGVQARGEWITGQPFEGTTTDGWYVDLVLHRRFMGPVTAVLRAERLDYDTVSRFALHSKRQTAGVRVRLPGGLTAQVNLLHQSGNIPRYRATTLDLAVTWSIRLN